MQKNQRLTAFSLSVYHLSRIFDYYIAKYGIIYKKGNTKQLSNAIKFLVNNKKCYNKIVENIKKSKSRFETSNCKKYLEIIDKYI